LQFGVDAARRFELEGAGAGPGDGRAFDAVARQQVAGMAGLVGGLGDRLAALLPAAQMLRRPQEWARAAIRSRAAERLNSTVNGRLGRSTTTAGCALKRPLH
jgi:hypothetical protein